MKRLSVTILTALVPATISFQGLHYPKTGRIHKLKIAHAPQGRLSMLKRTPSFLSASNSPTSSCVVSRLGLTGQFERWVFLQDLLDVDEDIALDDVHEVLFRILKSYSENPPPQRGEDPRQCTELSEEDKVLIDNLVQKGMNQGGLLRVFHDDSSPDHDPIDKDLESLLPSDYDEKDAEEGLWEMLANIIGREGFGMNQKENTNEWTVRCIVARLLVHYDFISNGIVETEGKN